MVNLNVFISEVEQIIGVQIEGRSTAECLDDLRLKIKYLALDLEATRRENRMLIAKIQEG